MGRKIPGKKHRGVKDPLKQRAQRLAELESKINAPPKDIDQQAIPKSLERVIKLKEAVKAGKIGGKISKRKRKKNPLICVGKSTVKSLHPKAKPEKTVPVFEQRPDESNAKFYNRVCKETHAFICETAFEKKYNIQVNRNPETGKIEGIGKRPKDEFEEALKMKHKNIKKKKNKQKGETLTKAQKRKLKLQMKKEKRLQNKDGNDEFDCFNDKVGFGEVVHAPPQLMIKPKRTETGIAAKPAEKDLLLKSLLKSESPKINNFNSTTNTISNKKRKRNSMPS